MMRLAHLPVNRVVGRFYNDLDNMLASLLTDGAPGAATGVRTAGNFPPVNVWEDSEGYHLEAELPGFKMDDLELTVKENELTVKGERKAPTTEGVTVHRQERGVGTFHRVVKFPVPLDAEKVAATLTNGVLTLHLPKAEKAKARKIEIRTA